MKDSFLGDVVIVREEVNKTYKVGTNLLFYDEESKIGERLMCRATIFVS